MTQKTIGPLKLTMARPISAPYSSCIMRSDSGEPSNPDRFASTTRGRLPLAALMARAVFLDDLGNRVPAGHSTSDVFPGRDIGVVVVCEQRFARRTQVGGPVLRLSVRSHDAVVSTDTEVVLG